MSRRGVVLLGLLALPGCARGDKPAPTAQASASPSASPKPYEVDTTTPLKDPLPMVAAKVDGREIPTAQVVVVAESLLSSGAVKDRILAYRQTLNQLVVRELMLAEAIRRGLAADAAAVERAYNEARVAYKEDAAWKEVLRKQGFTPEGFREELRAKQTVNLLLSEEAATVADPTDEQLSTFYKQNSKDLGTERLKVAHVLVRVKPDATPPQKALARGRAENARQQAAAGKDFEAVVKAYSDDETTRTRGGVIDPFGRGEMVKPVEDAAFELKIGEISRVVESSYGYHVLKLLEKIEGPPPPYEEIRDRLKQVLAQTKRQEHLQALADRLRARARVETFL